MKTDSKQNKLETRAFPGWAMLAYVVVISISVDAALLLSVAGKLSWIYSSVVAFSAAVLTAAALFTALATFKSDGSRMSR